MKNVFIFALFSCLGFVVQAQKALLPNKMELRAVKTSTPIKIDGVLDEEVWLTAPITENFTQNRPNPGAPAAFKSEVKIAYDNSGFYVGAKLLDPYPDSIRKELSERDDLLNTDWFGVIIDAYRDGINGFGFLTTPSDVQFDTKYSTFGEDSGWDAVWLSKTQITDEGWIVEMKIPYAAIRFPRADEQVWHINFVRSNARSLEKSFWSHVDPQVDGFLNQAGYLKGIQNITPPVRLQATPFIAVYGQHHHDKNNDPVNAYGRSINGGLDVKLGLSDAFTLDMTLIPDFGEAQSDNQVLNLSPFEVRFDENRAFFTEGTELFNKGGLFYSRRVGGRPIYYYDVEDEYEEDQIISNPQQTPLYNATKISGRTAKGTGIGFFNATSRETYATVNSSELGEEKILTNPLTNYNVLVVDQNLANNSYAALINTTVIRAGSAYDANVTGTDFLIRNKANSYSIGGQAVLSQQYHENGTDLGHTAILRLRKTSGNVEAGITYLEESDTYDPNDLGFLYNNNSREISGFIEYNKYEPFSKFNRGGIGLFTRYSRLYAPDEFTDAGFNIWAWAQGKNFWNYNLRTYITPVKSYDFFEARVDGRIWKRPPSGNVGVSISTDGRKKIRLNFNGNYWTRTEKQWYEVWTNIGARLRANDKLNFSLDIGRGFGRNDTGYADEQERIVTDPQTGEKSKITDVIFGRRNRLTLETNFRTNYTFNANMTLGFRLRHYWSKVIYNSFHLLDEDGNLGPTDYNDSDDFDFDAFTIDLVYRWRFAPGSDIYVVWKNSIFSHTDENISSDYFSNLDGLFNEPQSNSLSIKAIYFLDYASLKKRN